MKINWLHGWDVDYYEACNIQSKLVKKLSLEFPILEIKTVAGADIAYSKEKAELCAGVVLLKIPEFVVIEQVCIRAKVTFPYISSLLSFREAPHLAEAFKKLTETPDLAMFDGHGIAHPRGLGLASHMGLLLDLPTIGCAKKNLVGRFDSVGNQVGSFSLIEFSGQTVGAALRTKRNVKPVFVSPGHKINVEKSLEIVLKCISRYRIPEPIRRAHIYVNRVKRNARLMN